MNKKKIIIVVAILSILGFSYYYFVSNRNSKPEFFEAAYGNISRDIFESGAVKRGEDFVLGFKLGGTIDEIYVAVGEKVKKGDVLANIDNTDSKIRLEQAKRGVEMAKITLDKIISGVTEEELQTYKTSALNSEIALENSTIALQSAKQGLIIQLKDAYTKTDDAIRNKTDQFFENPRTANAFFSLSFIDGSGVYYFIPETNIRSEVNTRRYSMENYLLDWKPLIEEIENSNDLNNQIKTAEEILNEAKLFLDKMAFAVNSFSTDNFSHMAIVASYKADVSAARTLINTALYNLNVAKTSFNSAKSSYEAAEGTLNSAKNQLDFIESGARKEDIELQESQVRQQEAEIRLLEKQIEDSVLRAPLDGQIVEIKKRRNEIIQPGESLMSFISDDLYQVEVNIYEGEITKLEVGNTADIELVAFPGEKFNGRILSIDPSGKLIDGVVYFRIFLSLEKAPEKIMPGMTADVVISTVQKENVITILDSGILREDGKIFVQVIDESGNIEKREVVTGARGDGRIIEVISGLKEGERVIIK